MKRIILSLCIALTGLIVLGSCTASRQASGYGGCKMTQGMVGYR
jgi:hypothetical protein